MTMPTSMSNQQSASSGASGGTAGNGASDWVVNYGGEVSQNTGAGIPQWAWIAAVVLAIVWIKRKR